MALLRLLLKFAIVFLSTWALAGERVCVLYFERPEHPISKELFGKLDSKKQRLNSFVVGLSPADLTKCLETRPSKILIIAHGGLSGKNRDDYRLSFFLPKSEEVYQEERKNGLIELRKHRKNLTIMKTQQGCDQNVRYPCSLIHDKIKDFDRKNRLVNEQSLRFSIGYDQTLMLRRSFDVFVQKFEESPFDLKEIKFFSCDGEQVVAGYPNLKRLRNHGVHIHSAKKSKIWSLVYRKNVLSLDVDEVIAELR